MKRINILLLFFALLVGETLVGQGSGNCLDFDGTGNRVEIDNSGNLDIENAITLEAWVNPQTFKTTSPFISGILTKWQPVGEGYLLRMGNPDIANNQLQFVLRAGGNLQSANSTTLLNANTWYHVAATYDGANMRIYVNGELEDTQPLAGNIIVSTANLEIARDYADNDRTFDGQIDEVRIWDRALNEAEIRNSMCGQLQGSENGLAGYWGLNEGVDNTCDGGEDVCDLSGNGNHGTLQ